MRILSTRHLKAASCAGLVAAALGLAMAGRAEITPPESKGTATIDFPFVAGTKDYPAGSYQFAIDGNKITLRPSEPKGQPVVMLVITRLGRHDRDKGAELVFDKVGDRMKLSEIWPPSEDGYLVLITPETHGHRVVGGSNPH